jgi:DNA-binding transcriptional ArsR family regulator
MATRSNISPATTPRATAAKRAAKEADQRLRQAREASIMLKHVSDATRLQVILILAEGEQHVGALCDQLAQSQPAVSHHLALLRHGGIIAPRRAGKNNFYSLTEKGELLAKVAQGLID